MFLQNHPNSGWCPSTKVFSLKGLKQIFGEPYTEIESGVTVSFFDFRNLLVENMRIDGDTLGDLYRKHNMYRGMAVFSGSELVLDNIKRNARRIQEAPESVRRLLKLEEFEAIADRYNPAMKIDLKKE